MNSITRWWHRHRASRLIPKLRIAEERCRLLDEACRDYGSSRYTDLAIEAHLTRFTLHSKLRYHQDKLYT